MFPYNCAQAKKRHDQDSSKEVSPFECLTGQMPYSSRNLSLVARKQEEEIQVVHACHEFIPGVLDEEGFVKWIQRTREEGIGYHFLERRRVKVDAHLNEPTHLETQTKQVKAQAIFTQAEEITQRDVLDRDDTARDNVLSRQRKNSRAPHTHTLTFKVQFDDQVAHDGKLYLVKEVFGPEGYPITARLEQKESKKVKMAKVVKLRPPATPRPSMFFPRERPKFDDLIFFYLEESLEVGIMVSEEEENGHDDDDVDVHIYEGTEATLKIWLPTWRHKTSHTIVRRQRRPTGPYEENVRTVSIQDNEMIGALTDSGRLDPPTTKAAASRGFIKTE